LRRGRLAALGVLALFLVLQAAHGGAAFSPLRRVLFDAYSRSFPRERSAAPVVIVAVDDASLKSIGQWPWPRQLLAELVAKILAGGPLALGIDMVWPERDRLSPKSWLEQQGPLPAALARQLAGLPDHDDVLGATLASGPVAIGVAGQRDGPAEATGPLTPIRVIGGEPGRVALPGYDALLRSVPALDRAARGHGLLTVDRDPDGVIRRIPLLADAGGRLVPGFAVEILRLAAGADWVELRLREDAVSSVAVGPLLLPTQADGTIFVRFTPHDPQRFLAAADVLEGRTPPDLFAGRLVLIGVTGIGLVDLSITPLGPMPGSEIHAQLLENLLAREWLVRPAWTRFAEPALTALFALLLLALPAARPRGTVPAALFVLAALAAIGFGAFRSQRWLIDVATPAVGDAAVFVALLGGSLAEADAQRRRLRRELENERLAAAKVEGELAAAARIQAGILPRAADLPPDARFDLCALLAPARQIGGDLYDFFKIDANRLFFAIGDVSGKGVPASLFMAVGKALFKSCALRGEGEIGEIVRGAQSEIARDNPEMMFITLFAGILELETGELRFCNAGHDPPFVVRAGKSVRQLDAKGGPPLCSSDDFPYSAETHRMEPGEILLLATDGVSEAADRAGRLMGRERARDALRELPERASAGDAVERVQRAVAAFADGAAPSDDLALLAVRWCGPLRG
jgi:serine phosphatase RsbU (regulator of sigma subunit)/CHASE2 domain-containing sensor protein